MRHIKSLIVAAVAATFSCSLWASGAMDEIVKMVITKTDGTQISVPVKQVSDISFVKAEPSADEICTVTEVTSLTPGFLTVEGPAVGDTYLAGDPIDITLNAVDIIADGFNETRIGHVFVHVGDKVYTPASYTEGATSLVVSVPAPAGDCPIVVCYAVQQKPSADGYTMFLEEHPAVKLYGVDPAGKYTYFDAYLRVDDAFKLSGVEFKMGDGEWQSVNDAYGCSLSEVYDVPNLYNVSIRPGYSNVTGDVTLRVSGEQHARYNITWTNATDEYIDLAKSTFPTQAIDGDRVTAEMYVRDAYYVNGATASDGTELTLPNRFYVTFTMPKNDINITLDILSKIPVTYTESEHISRVEIYDAPDMYYGVPTAVGIPGESVHYFAQAETGYKPVKLVTDAGQEFPFVHYGDLIYRSEAMIPADATSMSASVITAKAYTISSEQVVVFDQGNIYAEGETVNMSIQVPTGKQIESVKAKTADGQDVPLTHEENAPYASLVMPASDVVVTVTYTDLPVGDQVSVIAYFDGDQYGVRSSTNYDWDFAEGFTIDKNATFYLSVFDYYGMEFYVGVKIGDNVTIYPADMDEDSGEYTFGKAIVAAGDVTIKVGPTESSVSF